MPLYDYRCEDGHVTEIVRSMSEDLPESILCEVEVTGCMTGQPTYCGEVAYRVFAPPAAIHFHGGGFYETDYRGKYNRRRRPNPGDDMAIPSEAAITKAEGAEYDPPARMPETITREDAPRSA